MGTVNSDHVKASSEGAFGTSNESCYDPLNIVFRELVRLSILLIERKGTWSDHCFRPATEVSGDSSTRIYGSTRLPYWTYYLLAILWLSTRRITTPRN